MPEPDASPDQILCMAASADKSSSPAETWTSQGDVIDFFLSVCFLWYLQPQEQEKMVLQQLGPYCSQETMQVDITASVVNNLVTSWVYLRLGKRGKDYLTLRLVPSEEALQAFSHFRAGI